MLLSTVTYFVLAVLSCGPSCVAFRSLRSRNPLGVPVSSSRLSEKKISGNSSKQEYVRYLGYNDDAFGLVFLTGSLVDQDIVFSTTFVLFSAVAAIVRNSRNENSKNKNHALQDSLSRQVKGNEKLMGGESEKLKDSKNHIQIQRVERYLVPSAVAVNSYITSGVLSSTNFIHDNIGIYDDVNIINTWESKDILGAVLVSTVYGLYQSSRTGTG